MCQGFKRTVSSSFPPPKATLKCSCGGVCSYLCVCVGKHLYVRGLAVKARQRLRSLLCWQTGLRGCQHHSTTGCRGSHSHYGLPMFPDKSVCGYRSPCLCVCERPVESAMACAAATQVETQFVVQYLQERERERKYPACSRNFIFLPLFIQSWSTEHTWFFLFFFILPIPASWLFSQICVAGYKYPQCSPPSEQI